MRQVRFGQLPYGGKESRVQVLRCDLGQELAMLRRIFRTDGPQDHAAAAVLQLLLQLAGVGADCQPGGRAGGARRDAYARIERDDAMLVGQQWVDVELDNLCDIDGKLRELHQGRLDLRQVRGCLAVPAREHARDPGP